MSRIRWYQAGCFPGTRACRRERLCGTALRPAVILEDDLFREGNPVRYGRRAD